MATQIPTEQWLAARAADEHPDGASAKCSTCKWFASQAKECRRYPPTAMEQPSAYRGMDVGMFPLVLNTDWCGEWVGKDA